MGNAREKALAVCRQIKSANASGTCTLCHSDFLDFVRSVAGVKLDNDLLTQLLEAAECSRDGRVQLEEFMLWVFRDPVALPSVDRPRRRLSTASLIRKSSTRSLASPSVSPLIRRASTRSLLMVSP